MVNNIKDFLIKISSGNEKKIKIIVTVGLIGIILIFASELTGDNAKNTQAEAEAFDYSTYTTLLEERLTDTISSIEGVGRCKVMLTLENTTESIYATDNEIKSDNDSLNQKDEYVLYDTSNGEMPVLLKEKLPQVQGVTVICDGGDNTKIKEKIIEAVTALFNISSSRVSVSKIRA